MQQDRKFRSQLDKLFVEVCMGDELEKYTANILTGFAHSKEYDHSTKVDLLMKEADLERSVRELSFTQQISLDCFLYRCMVPDLEVFGGLWQINPCASLTLKLSQIKF